MYSSSPEGDRTSAEERSQPSRSHSRKRKPLSIEQKLCGPLPLSEAGQRLASLFPNGWDWLYADAPNKGTQIEWETIKKFPLSPVEQWTLHQDPGCIIGMRPASTTRWGIIDIDHSSPYHPTNDPEALSTILNALEDIGIVRTLLNQSSHSKGLHIYIPLPEAMSSFSIAVALKYTLEGAGIKLRSGQCEIFPNPKRYIPKGQGFSLYNGIRLPMQPNIGFIPLDPDLNALPWTLEDWLDSFDSAALHQDLRQLEKAMVDAEHNHRIRGHRNPKSLESWSERIEIEKQGWSGPGQTNDKLKLFACEARVFMGMDTVEQISHHIQRTAKETPGYYEYSSHVKDLAQRSKDVATWAMRYYWPMGAQPSRDIGYQSQPPAPADFSYHQAKREAAQHRIRQAVEDLKATDQLPSTATARAKAITLHAHISQQTLYKPINKPLWHPDHSSFIETPRPPEQATPHIPQAITPETKSEPKKDNTKPPQRLINKGITQLYKYVGFVINQFMLGALEALAPQGQRASEKAVVTEEILERGGVGGEQTTPVIKGWNELRKSLPSTMQQKILKAEQSRQRRDELEQKRRARVAAQRQQLKLDFASRPQTPEELSAIEDEVSQHFSAKGIVNGVDLSQIRQLEAGPTLGQTVSAELQTPCGVEESYQPWQGQEEATGNHFVEFGEVQTLLERIDILPESGELGCQEWNFEEARAPFDWERTEFNQWYKLALQFKLVADYQWRESQYWVLVNGYWTSFCEMIGVFSCRRLRGYLGQG